MRTTAIAVFGASLCLAASALAWQDNNMTQPTADQIAVWAYPSKQNYCPNGLQPVTIGGVICCGSPTHVGYASHPKPKPRRAHKPQAYVVYEKGQ